MSKQSITCHLRKLRKQAGLTQRQLSQLSGVSEDVIAKYERGVNRPKVRSAEKLAKALGVEVKAIWPKDSLYLVGEIGQAPNRQHYQSGRKLKEARFAAGYRTVRQLAETIDISESVIGSYEYGYNKPSQLNMKILSIALNFDVASLYAGKTLRQSKQVPIPGSDGERLRNARKAKGYSGVALAELATISNISLSQYELGQAITPPLARAKLAAALGVDEDSIWQVPFCNPWERTDDPQWQRPNEIRTSGDRIKSTRINQKLSRKELAATAEVRVGVLQNWEENRQIPVLASRKRIIVNLNLSWEEVFGEGPHDKPAGSGARIAAFRQYAGMSITELAQACGVSRARIHQIESRRFYYEKPALLPVIAAALKVSEEELWGCEDARARSECDDQSERLSADS